MSKGFKHAGLASGQLARHAAACAVALALAIPTTIPTPGVAAALWLESSIYTYSNPTNGVSSVAGSNFALTPTGSATPAVPGATSDSFSATATASASVDMNRLTDGYARGLVTWTTTFLDPFYAGQMAFTTAFSGLERAYTNYYANSKASNDYFISVLLNGVSVPLSWTNGVQSTSTSCSLPAGFFEYECSRTNLRANNGYTALFSVVNGDVVTVSGWSNAYANGNTDIGSAEASASNRLTWTLHAVPEPSTALVLLPALAALWFARRHTWTQERPGA